ncbi:MAG: hypothetical protein KatS3mg090_0384 [Patescibacteria group bacterium]|nr:MAG: hypothetical protein KatS3mg090_0384 [Patescibacteria group bacterium]
MIGYYKKKIYLPQIDKKGKIIGKVERWQAHFEGILHIGFTTLLKFKDQILIQIRKHPIFDGKLDLSFSSHPYYKHNKLIYNKTSIIETLTREWIWENQQGLPQQTDIKFLFKIKYRSQDKQNKLGRILEHEINHYYIINLKTLPKPNPDYSYGYAFITEKKLKNLDLYPFKPTMFAPWIKIILKKNCLKKL